MVQPEATMKNEVKRIKVPQMNCVDFYWKVTVSRQVQIRKQWQKEERIKDKNWKSVGKSAEKKKTLKCPKWTGKKIKFVYIHMI